MNGLFLGIDGGGTYTRAAIADAQGNLFSSVKREGGAFLAKNPNARENVSRAVREATNRAGCGLGDITALAAGVAGYDKRRDLRWVRKLMEIDGLACVKEHINDAVIAVRGAFLLQPGIAAIGGTGSIIVGMTEKGKFIRNYDFRHHANVSATMLSYTSVKKIIKGEADGSDQDLVSAVLQGLGAEEISHIKPLKEYSLKDFSDLGPAVTQAALHGSHIAEEVCARAAREVVEGIRLVDKRFQSRPIPVALVGSSINSAYVKNAITELLLEDPGYILREPALPPVLGAILMAMRLREINIDERIISNLRKGAEEI